MVRWQQAGERRLAVCEEIHGRIVRAFSVAEARLDGPVHELLLAFILVGRHDELEHLCSVVGVGVFVVVGRIRRLFFQEEDAARRWDNRGWARPHRPQKFSPT